MVNAAEHTIASIWSGGDNSGAGAMKSSIIGLLYSEGGPPDNKQDRKQKLNF